MSQQPIRILLADDHTLVRRGIAQLLSMEGDMQVVGEAEDGREAYNLAVELRPDLILLDLKMPNWGGLEVLQRLREELPDTTVVILTYSVAEADVMAALRLGAHGYLLKNLEPEVLCADLRAAMRGESPISGQVARKLLLGLKQGETAGEPEPEAAPEELLSEREQEIVHMIVQGATNREIAASLFLSEHTVKNHVRRILAKLDLQNRTQVVAWAMRLGIGQV